MTYPRISIITPSFNQGKFLEQTIESVLSQNYPDLEYIVIDGGSTDNSVEIIRKYEKHLSYWVSEKDKGQSDAINKGFARSTGRVMNWLNSDDYYSPGVLHAAAESFSGGATAVCGRLNFLYRDGRSALSGHFPHSRDIVEVMASTKYLQPCTFYNADFIRAIGGLNPRLHYCMDYELWMKYLMMYGLSGLAKNDNLVVNFRFHETSKSTRHAEKFRQDLFILFASVLGKVRPAFMEKYAGPDGGYSFDMPVCCLDENVIRSACALFFYNEAVFWYGKKSFVFFDRCCGLIETNLLSEDRQKELKRMIRRREVIPGWMFRMIGK